MKLSQWRLLHACTLSTSYSCLKRYYNSYRANQSALHAETARKRNKTVRILLKLKDQGTLCFVFSCHSKCFCYYIDFEIKNEVSFIICLLSFISILQLYGPSSKAVTHWWWVRTHYVSQDLIPFYESMLPPNKHYHE